MLVHQPTVKNQTVCSMFECKPTPTHTHAQHACVTHAQHACVTHAHVRTHTHTPLIAWLSNNVTGFAEFHHPGKVLPTAGAVVLSSWPHCYVHLHLLLLGPHTHPHHTLTAIREVGWAEWILGGGGEKLYTLVDCQGVNSGTFGTGRVDSSLIPRPFIQHMHIISLSVQHAILKAIHAGIGLGLGPRLGG